MAGGYHSYTTGQVLDAPELNQYVRDQTVNQFATTANRDSAISTPVEGMVAAITGEDRLYVYDGSAWQRLSSYSLAGRTGCEVRRAANQSFTVGTAAAFTFDTVTTDNDSWHSGGTFTTVTVPSGLGGFYLIRASVSWSVAQTSAQMWFSIAGTDYAANTVAGAVQSSATWVSGTGFELAAGNTVGVKALENSGTVNGTCILQLWRVLV
jgi:hypothetical protein